MIDMNSWNITSPTFDEVYVSYDGAKLQQIFQCQINYGFFLDIHQTFIGSFFSCVGNATYLM